MNYISHYFLDAVEGDVYYNVGLVLPDMMSAAERGWKPATTSGISSQNQQRLHAGVQSHLEADRIFHNTPFFREESRRLHKLVEQSGAAVSGMRLFFVGHVLLEMMMDRIIIRKYPERAIQFYDDLDLADDKEIFDYLIEKGSERMNRFILFFSRFRQHRYLLTYTDTAQLFYALNRMLTRGSQPVFPDSSYPVFSELITEIEPDLEKKTMSFFDTVKSNT